MNSEHTAIAMPPTTSHVVVFPFKSADKKFDSSFYTPALTDGRVPFEEITQFLAEIEAQKPTAQSNASPWRLVALLFLFILWTFRFVVQSKMDSDMIPYVFLVVIVLVLVIIFILVVTSKRGVNEPRPKCQAIVDKYNQNLASRGLRWYLPVSFPKWVELWKDYPQNQNQGVVLPPVNQQPYPAVQNYGVPNQNYQGQVNNNNYIPPSQF